MGWKEVIGQTAKKEEDLIPSMKDGDDAVVVDAKCESKKTTPPPHFTEGTLIAAMSNIHRFVKDPDIKKTLKENEGIGTEATRSNMLEMLLRRNFINGKQGKKTYCGPRKLDKTSFLYCRRQQQDRYDARWSDN